ncbi:MAG: nuclear transport factor 2 family protein [Gemmatimonadales bacterium]
MTRYCLVLVAGAAACAVAEEAPPSFDHAEQTRNVSHVLDSLHAHAAAANGQAYFALFAPEAVFFGTDITERWTLEQFRGYAMGRFDQGTGWTYILRPGTRNVEFDPSGTVAWFDEILDNANYGETRGTGVIRLVDGAWRIAQYHLTIPVPNDLASRVVGMIRSID